MPKVHGEMPPASMKPVAYRHGEFIVTTDRARLSERLIHQFLSQSYWAEGIPRKTVARSLRNSLCFGLFEGSRQIGFARVITDYATFAYLADVFILEEYRSRGLAKFLLESVLKHPRLQARRASSVSKIRLHPSGATGEIHGTAQPERLQKWEVRAWPGGEPDIRTSAKSGSRGQRRLEEALVLPQFVPAGIGQQREGDYAAGAVELPPAQGVRNDHGALFEAALPVGLGGVAEDQAIRIETSRDQHGARGFQKCRPAGGNTD
jgi:GNAT superfamily N-acetyltransferase